MLDSGSSPGVDVAAMPSGLRAIPGADTSVAAFVGRTASGPCDEPQEIRGFAEYEARFGGLTADRELGFAVRQFFRNGGRRAWVVRVAAGTAGGSRIDWMIHGRGAPPALSQLSGDPERGSGIYALEKVAGFNLLCIPEMSLLTDRAAAALVAQAGAYCEGRGAFLLIDPPRQLSTAAGVARWARQELKCSHSAALYFPFVLIADPTDALRLRPSPPSGTIAGLFARTDRGSGVWQAPEGPRARLVNVQELAYHVTDEESDRLQRTGVNCLRAMPDAGRVCWGARTLTGESGSEWSYVPVRRLALYIEESISRGTEWTVYEPNDEALWERIRQSATDFMHGLFRRGAFRGASPREAYFVRCDAETTTPAEMDVGHTNLMIGFAPLKPAEFVILTIQLQSQTRRGA